MEKKCKPSLGQFFKGKLLLTDEEKMTIINAYLSGKESKTAVYFRYTGIVQEHGRLSKWMNQFGNFKSVSQSLKSKFKWLR
jgi:transposase-like protein